MCGVNVPKPKDELIVGTLTYCTATCRNLHLPSEHRRVRSLILKALGLRRLPESVRVLLVDAMRSQEAR